MNSQPPRKDYSVYALGGHILLASVSGVVIMMYVPVLFDEASGEGAGMGVFMLLFFLGAPLAVAAFVTALFSIRSPNPGLLLPTALLFVGVPVAATLQSDQAFVLALCLYIAGVLRAIFLRVRRESSK